MLGLNKKENKIFRACLVGHLLLGAGLFFSGLLPSCKEEPEKVHVFQLADSAVPKPVESPIVKVAPPTPPKPKVPPKIVPPSPAPKPPTPKPNPPVLPKPKPKNNPPPVTPKARNPKPSKPISIDQFRRDRNIPSHQVQAQRPRTPQFEPIKLNPDNFKLDPIIITRSSPSSSSVSPNAINQYLARVKAKLEGIWRNLLENSELSDGGVARLSFRISSRGALISPRISKSSGNPNLDRLVLEVARRGGVFGPPPGGTLNSDLEIPFQVH